MSVPARLAGLVDDAAIFPPGSAPLPAAVAAHLRHRSTPHADIVGPLVLSTAALAELPAVLTAYPGASLEVSVTVPTPDALGTVASRACALPGVRLVALEVAVPADASAADVVPAIDAALADAPCHGVQVYVEVPRDPRRAELLPALAGSTHRAKFRTGGVEAHLYPDVAELAAAIARAIELRLPFKATAGIHHAIRNTDPQTGFAQHGFLNVLLATEAALRGEPAASLERLLAERDGPHLAAAFAALPDDAAAATRAAFVSFGSCSVTDPLSDLIDLGLVPADQGAHR